MVDSLKQGGERFRKAKALMWPSRKCHHRNWNVTCDASVRLPRDCVYVISRTKANVLPATPRGRIDGLWSVLTLRWHLNSWRKLWRALRWNYAILTHVVAKTPPKKQKTQKTNKMTWLMKSQTCCWMAWFVWVSLYNNDKNLDTFGLNLHTHNRMIFKI